MNMAILKLFALIGMTTLVYACGGIPKCPSRSMPSTGEKICVAPTSEDMCQCTR